MPRLNSNLTQRDARQNGNGGLAKHLTFWNLVVGTMGVLALKERWEEYQANKKGSAPKLASDDPEAAAGLLARATAYRDDPTEAAAGGILEDPIRLSSGNPDSRAPSVVPDSREPYRRKRNCCGCCGGKCALFCKALGIVVLLYTIYGAYKLISWATTPDPTGLEDMPEYSTSLGCLDGKYIFGPSSENNADGVSYTLPIDSKTAALHLDFTGAAAGTILLTQTDSTDTAELTLKLRTNEEALLAKVSVDAGSTGGAFWKLATPTEGDERSCMRFDAILRTPKTLRNLTLSSTSITQLKYFEDASFDLTALDVFLAARSNLNMFLPHEQIGADYTKVELRRGYAVGKVSLRKSAKISTARGDGIAKLEFVVADGEDAPELSTNTGLSGQADFTYMNPDGRPVHAEHASAGAQLYLRYAGARFNGPIDIQASGWSSRGHVENFGMHNPKGTPFVGSEDGPDRLKIRTPGSVKTWF
ncbi:hypothetical protein EXIGLDRAFT_671270 [Exidia glandulosa HHB12029]|uniref:Uncharacterized protein n=1 Tax=Exidia glandulosa HHB12029 TaxID=1314781 RepID=A0A165KG93_EXIGL|nr:hypothetical protein EXIGLDRAFT_671270 [Exidia glandulosa HHB12029]